MLADSASRGQTPKGQETAYFRILRDCCYWKYFWRLFSWAYRISNGHVLRLAFWRLEPRGWMLDSEMNRAASGLRTGATFELRRAHGRCKDKRARVCRLENFSAIVFKRLGGILPPGCVEFRNGNGKWGIPAGGNAGAAFVRHACFDRLSIESISFVWLGLCGAGKRTNFYAVGGGFRASQKTSRRGSRFAGHTINYQIIFTIQHLHQNADSKAREFWRRS
jgi:hypothetical protein